jgi:hypothetical protein
MSNHQAIAAVTATLRSLLDKRFIAEGLTVTVTARPPDRVSTANGATQLNLFLYLTSQSAAMRNMSIPQKLKPGETGPPPLALNLYYLITVYGPDDENEDLVSHQLLGKAMNVLHDHPLLGADEIRDATSSIKASDLHNQIERIRITQKPMSSEEMSKLWTTFQTNFRISAAYEVAVVLIESARASRTPLPVLARGKDDEGASAQGNLTPTPTLEAIKIPGDQLSAKLGDELILTGFNLSGSNLQALILPPHREKEIEATTVGQSTDKEIRVRLPADPAVLPAGYYRLRVKVRKSVEAFDRYTNTLVFSIAPKIIAPPLPLEVLLDPDGNVTLNVTPEPQVLPEQTASLLLGDLEVVAGQRAQKTDPLVFEIRKAIKGVYLARLRVDGVDSLLVDTSKTPPVFDQTQTVTIK